MTTNENGDASASEGAEARKTTRTRKRWTQRAAYLSSVSNAMVAVVARAPPLPRDSRACNDSLGKSAPRVRCERRVRGPVTAPNAPSARPLRASPRVSSSARAALPRPQARPRVPRATRPPTRVTSKKTPRRVEIRPRRKQTSLSEPSINRKSRPGSNAKGVSSGKYVMFPLLRNREARSKRTNDGIDSIKIAARVGLRAERPTPLAFRCIHKKAS